MKKTAKIIADMLIGLEKHATALLSCLKAGLPALLVGETGTGKSSLAEKVAMELGRPFVRVNLDGGSTPDELIGRYQLRTGKDGESETYFQKGIIPHALEAGAILCLDEINAALPDTLFVLHPLLERNPRLMIPETGEILSPAAGFGIIATMNPSSDYAGTKTLNPALLSRFGALVRFEPLKGKQLLEALAVHEPAALPDNLARCADLFERLNSLRVSALVNTRITLRECLAALAMIRVGLALDAALDVAIGSKLESHEREQARANGIALSGSRAVKAVSVSELLDKLDQAADLEKENKKLTKKIEQYASVQVAIKTVQDATAPEEVSE